MYSQGLDYVSYDVSLFDTNYSMKFGPGISPFKLVQESARLWFHTAALFDLYQMGPHEASKSGYQQE